VAGGVIVSPSYLIARFEGPIDRNLNVRLVLILKDSHDKEELSWSKMITTKSLSLKWDAVNVRAHAPCYCALPRSSHEWACVQHPVRGKCSFSVKLVRPDCSVGTVKVHGLDGRGSIPVWGKRIFSSPQRPQRLWDPPSQWVPGAGAWSWLLTSI
jgi:hypothetical protein